VTFRRAVAAVGDWIEYDEAWPLGVALRAFQVVVAFAVLVALSVGVVWGATWLTDKAIDTKIVAVQIMILLLWLFPVMGILEEIVGDERIQWSRVRRGELPVAALQVAVYIAFATIGFAALAAVLYQHGLIHVSGGAPEEGHLTQSNEIVYLRHSLTAVPLLHIPATLNWRAPYRFSDHLGGALILAYTIVLVAPILRIFGDLVQQVYSDDDGAAAQAHDTTALP
jgi:hypothetical protein